MRKNYNYTRRKLYLPEYGRHIQNMVDSLFEIEDRRERTRQAKAVIAVMGNLNPLLRDTADFAHKLWDHLFIMSDFQLDVDSPYPRPTRQDIMVEPRHLEYPQSRIERKHYGKYVGQIIKRLATAPDGALRTSAVNDVAHYMRTKSFEYNQEHPSNDVVAKDIEIMSDSVIKIDGQTLNNVRPEYKSAHTAHQSRQQRRPMQKGKNNGRQQQKNHSKNGQRHNSHK